MTRCTIPAPFLLVETGGGCTAWEAHVGGGRTLLVTEAETQMAPADAARPVDAGLYGPDAGEPDPILRFASVEVLLDWLGRAGIWACDIYGTVDLDADGLADCCTRDRS